MTLNLAMLAAVAAFNACLVYFAILFKGMFTEREARDSALLASAESWSPRRILLGTVVDGSNPAATPRESATTDMVHGPEVSPKHVDVA